MKIKLDENLPSGLATVLISMGHDTDTVPNEQLSGKSDPIIWQASQDAGRFLITQDMDFSNAHHYQSGTHHGLLLVRLNQPSRRRLIEHIKHIFETEQVDTWQRCFVITTEKKIRVRKFS